MNEIIIPCGGCPDNDGNQEHKDICNECIVDVRENSRKFIIRSCNDCPFKTWSGGPFPICSKSGSPIQDPQFIHPLCSLPLNESEE